MDDLFNVSDVAERIGVTEVTIGNWYKFKNENPDNEYAKLLPDIIRRGPRNARFWTEAGINQLQEFKNKIPKGCVGVMGNITQRYSKNTKKGDK